MAWEETCELSFCDLWWCQYWSTRLSSSFVLFVPQEETAGDEKDKTTRAPTVSEEEERMKTAEDGKNPALQKQSAPPLSPKQAAEMDKTTALRGMEETTAPPLSPKQAAEISGRRSAALRKALGDSSEVGSDSSAGEQGAGGEGAAPGGARKINETAIEAKQNRQKLAHWRDMDGPENNGTTNLGTANRNENNDSAGRNLAVGLGRGEPAVGGKPGSQPPSVGGNKQPKQMQVKPGAYNKGKQLPLGKNQVLEVPDSSATAPPSTAPLPRREGWGPPKRNFKTDHRLQHDMRQKEKLLEEALAQTDACVSDILRQATEDGLDIILKPVRGDGSDEEEVGATTFPTLAAPSPTPVGGGLRNEGAMGDGPKKGAEGSGGNQATKTKAANATGAPPSEPPGSSRATAAPSAAPTPEPTKPPGEALDESANEPPSQTGIVTTVQEDAGVGGIGGEEEGGEAVAEEEAGDEEGEGEEEGEEEESSMSFVDKEAAGTNETNETSTSAQETNINETNETSTSAQEEAAGTAAAGEEGSGDGGHGEEGSEDGEEGSGDGDGEAEGEEGSGTAESSISFLVKETNATNATTNETETTSTQEEDGVQVQVPEGYGFLANETNATSNATIKRVTAQEEDGVQVPEGDGFLANETNATSAQEGDGEGEGEGDGEGEGGDGEGGEQAGIISKVQEDEEVPGAASSVSFLAKDEETKATNETTSTSTSAQQEGEAAAEQATEEEAASGSEEDSVDEDDYSEDEADYSGDEGDYSGAGGEGEGGEGEGGEGEGGEQQGEQGFGGEQQGEQGDGGEQQEGGGPPAAGGEESSVSFLGGGMESGTRTSAREGEASGESEGEETTASGESEGEEIGWSADSESEEESEEEEETDDSEDEESESSFLAKVNEMTFTYGGGGAAFLRQNEKRQLTKTLVDKTKKLVRKTTRRRLVVSPAPSPDAEDEDEDDASDDEISPSYRLGVRFPQNSQQKTSLSCGPLDKAELCSIAKPLQSALHGRTSVKVWIGSANLQNTFTSKKLFALAGALDCWGIGQEAVNLNAWIRNHSSPDWQVLMKSTPELLASDSMSILTARTMKVEVSMGRGKRVKNAKLSHPRTYGPGHSQ